jgi:uncharacterized protein (DUF924 family)
MRAHIEGILSYWFGLARTEPSAVPQQYSLWFDDSPKTDAELHRRFAREYDMAVVGKRRAWEETARGRLALIILLDQFSRNFFRGRPEAFAHDGTAQRLCLEGMAQELDLQLSPMERGFFYMPLQHAEQVHLQERSVGAYTRLADDVGPEWKPHIENMLEFALEHRDVIRRFSRFPHRNPILGRPSTAEEQAYMRSGASSYGQTPTG